MKKIKLFINQDMLKIVALVTMTIDHVSKYLLTGMLGNLGVCIGRISFPIFAFLLIKHLAERHIYRKYIIRLSIFGFLSCFMMYAFVGIVKEVKFIPFNILISFLNVVLFLFVVKWINEEKGDLYIKLVFYVLSFLCFGLLSVVCDYSIFGFLFMIFLYLYFKSNKPVWFVFCLIFSILINIGDFDFVISFLMTLILFMNNDDIKPKRIITRWWIFYVYYPLHLLVIMLLSLLFFN